MVMHKRNKQKGMGSRQNAQSFGGISPNPAPRSRMSATGVTHLQQMDFNVMQADPVPARCTSVHKWCIVASLASSTTPAQCGTEYVLNINGLFDPDLTGGTHQPYGFDQYAALWSKNIVKYCDVRLTTTCPAALNWTGAVAVLAQPDSTFTGLTGLALSDVLEKQGGDRVLIESTGETSELCLRIDLAKLCGLTPAEYIAQDRYSGSSTANPTTPAYLRMALANFTNVTSNTIAIFLELAFVVEWYDRIVLPASN